MEHEGKAFLAGGRGEFQCITAGVKVVEEGCVAGNCCLLLRDHVSQGLKTGYSGGFGLG
jgi:hypothetical protein